MYETQARNRANKNKGFVLLALGGMSNIVGMLTIGGLFTGNLIGVALDFLLWTVLTVGAIGTYLSMEN